MRVDGAVLASGFCGVWRGCAGRTNVDAVAPVAAWKTRAMTTCWDAPVGCIPGASRCVLNSVGAEAHRVIVKSLECWMAER